MTVAAIHLLITCEIFKTLLTVVISSRQWHYNFTPACQELTKLSQIDSRRLLHSITDVFVELAALFNQYSSQKVGFLVGRRVHDCRYEIQSLFQYSKAAENSHFDLCSVASQTCARHVLNTSASVLNSSSAFKLIHLWLSSLTSSLLVNTLLN